MRPPSLNALTGVRFVAAMLVALYHEQARFVDWSADVHNIVLSGSAAGGLFFLLSGFKLAYTYIDRKTLAREFWIARFARI